MYVFIENPLENPLDLSSALSRNAEGEHPSFSSTPLCDSSNHEDVDQHPKFSDLGCCDLFTSSSDHDVDLLIVNLFKPLVYEDPSINEIETPKSVKELQPELMVMSGPHCSEVGFTFDHEIFQTLKAPHHSFVCTQDQYNTIILLPPRELHNPITHALEESYTSSTLVKHKWSTFLTFA